MKKEYKEIFQAFKLIKDLIYDRVSLYGIEEYRKSLSIIENALNDNYFYEHIINKICDFMGLGILEPFNDLVLTENAMIDYICDADKIRETLDIIKEKDVNIQHFKSCLKFDWDYELFEKNCQDNNEWEEYPPYRHSMTKEEFEIVKGALL